MRNAMLVVLVASLVLFVSQSLESQSIPHAVVKGRVLDDSTRTPLALVNVFVSNSTIGTATDSTGMFMLRDVPLGDHEIVASIVGYTPLTKRLSLRDTIVYEVDFWLRPKAIEVQGVEVDAKVPEEWRKNLEWFLKEFLGSTENSKQCKVLNPEVLDFETRDNGILVASARTPLEMENFSLGYHVRVFLDYFTVKQTPPSNKPTSAGATVPIWHGGWDVEMVRPEPMIWGDIPTTMELVCRTKFTPLEPRGEKERAQWNKNRKAAYLGSLRHFLTSIVAGKSEDEGFKVSEIYPRRVRKAPLLRMNVDADTLATPAELGFERHLSFSNLLQVVYDGADEKVTSWIRLSRVPVVFYINGMIPNPLLVTTFGYWATLRAAEMLPIDYVPERD